MPFVSRYGRPQVRSSVPSGTLLLSLQQPCPCKEVAWSVRQQAVVVVATHPHSVHDTAIFNEH